MRYLTLTLFFVVLLFGQSFCKIDYYWRDYTGTIPPDAVIVGKDIDGNDLYVGQGYLKNLGWVVAPIYNGTKEVTVVLGGLKKIEKYIKILCGPQNNFHWQLTSDKTFDTDLKDKHVVVGGHEDGHGDLYIGRIFHEGETKIGKVHAFKVATTKNGFYFNNRGQEKLMSHPYQVLYFDENSLIDPRM